MNITESDFGGLFWDPYKQDWVQVLFKTFTQDEKEELLTILGEQDEDI